MAENLRTNRYWRIPKGGEIAEISHRIDDVCQGKDPGPADLGPEVDIDAAAVRAERMRSRAILPHRIALESELSQNLSWISAKLGESEAMKLVEKDWLVVGKTIVFGADEPSYSQVKAAVSEALDRRDKALKAT